MADCTSWRETTTRQVFELSAPSNVAELSKMINWACSAYSSAHGKEPSDDAITVSVTEDAVVATFVLEKGRLQ